MAVAKKSIEDDVPYRPPMRRVSNSQQRNSHNNGPSNRNSAGPSSQPAPTPATPVA